MTFIMTLTNSLSNTLLICRYQVCKLTVIILVDASRLSDFFCLIKKDIRFYESSFTLSDNTYVITDFNHFSNAPANIKAVVFLNDQDAIGDMNFNHYEFHQLECMVIHCFPTPNPIHVVFQSIDSYFVLSYYILDLPRLRSLVVSNGCFSKTTGLVINELNCLEYVEINNECFGSERKMMNCSCRITNCPNLIDLKIGSKCFTDYESFIICNVDSLQFMTFGSNAFVHSDCVLKGR